MERQSNILVDHLNGFEKPDNEINNDISEEYYSLLI